MRTVLRNPALLTLSLGHAAIDMLNSSVPILLAAFALQYGLSNETVGTIAMVYILVASLTQPFFGLAVDRWNSRWLGIAGIAWMATGFLIAAFLPGRLTFVAMIFAGLGSGLYHPQGTMNARRVSGDNIASGTSLFFFFGMSGLAVGPLLSGLLLAWLPFKLTIVTLVALISPALLLIAWFAPREGYHARPTPAAKPAGESFRINWTMLSLIAFLGVLLFRGWPPQATNTFLPKWLGDAGFASHEFGGLLSAFMFSSALGTIFGGWLADRWSRKGVVVLPLALAPIPFYLLYLAPSIAWSTFGLVVLAGFATGMPHSVMVLMGQNLFPGRMGFGSGLVLGSMFSVGALASWLTGWLGDRIGLHQALQLVPWICIAGACCALALPATRPRRKKVAVATRGGEAGGR